MESGRISKMADAPMLPATASLSTADFANVTDFNAAVAALYDQGYTYELDIPKGSDSWIVFAGYWIKNKN
jgi:hypothetical protein